MRILKPLFDFELKYLAFVLERLPFKFALPNDGAADLPIRFGLGTVHKFLDRLRRRQRVPNFGFWGINGHRGALDGQLTFQNVTNDVNANQADFSTTPGIPKASVLLSNPSHAVCGPNRTSFNIFVNFVMPPGANSLNADETNTYISESGTRWQALNHSFQDVSYSLETGTMAINMRSNNENEDPSKNFIRIRITGHYPNGHAFVGVGKVQFACNP